MDVTEVYGINVFNEGIMRRRLPKPIFEQLQEVQHGEAELSLEVAEVVANAMKDWAIEKGATHYTHWFQPLTGLTAEKHESFISPSGRDKVIMEFSGKELIMGEPDASSFPSGGLRATFEARGYTAWDPTSPAFLKEDKTGVTLYIPTAFVSYRGEALDKKVPLLRSMEAINRQALRVLRALGNTGSSRVIPTVGPEQEYFLIDKEYFYKRPDLMLTGRTVFGSTPAKGQELDDHYFGSIKERVSGFMRELNTELWKLGISAKTQHNEVAPNQFELATIFDTSNVATDYNQLVMETLRRVAIRHDLITLLHEKPFDGVNGSGKHNNWSLSTDDGFNLLEPGDDPHDNAQFLLFLTAVIRAVDEYSALLRMSSANTGNDHRLGANEAPPAIISIFLGEILSDIMEKLSKGEKVQVNNGEHLELGVTTMPKIPKHLADRNRTSPFAFTGNKFEFRMVPSSGSISEANTTLNTAVAEVLRDFADRLEAADNIQETVKELVRDTYHRHKRVVFNGNNYSRDWVEEAEHRGLPNITTTVDAIAEMTEESSVELFDSHGVYSREELASRQSICYENYVKQIAIEANVMVSMGRASILPAAFAYSESLANSISALHQVDPQLDSSTQRKTLEKLLGAIGAFDEELDTLASLLDEGRKLDDAGYEQARFYRYHIFEQMKLVRSSGDTLETIVPRDKWPFPSYEEMLFRL